LRPFWMRWGGQEDVEVHVEGKARKMARFKPRLWLQLFLCFQIYAVFGHR